MSDLNDLILELQQMNKGANAHTINKSIFYLEEWRHKNPARRDILVIAVRKSIQSGNWKEVKDLLSKLW